MAENAEIVKYESQRFINCEQRFEFLLVVLNRPLMLSAQRWCYVSSNSGCPDKEEYTNALGVRVRILRHYGKHSYKNSV